MQILFLRFHLNLPGNQFRQALHFLTHGIQRTATGMDSPLSAEQYLNEYRMTVLDKIAPLDNFSVDAVYNYGLRLMLVERMNKFNKDEGLTSYRKLYDEILGETK